MRGEVVHATLFLFRRHFDACRENKLPATDTSSFPLPHPKSSSPDSQAEAFRFSNLRALEGYRRFTTGPLFVFEIPRGLIHGKLAGQRFVFLLLL